MNWNLVRAIILLPGNVLVFIPFLILWLSPDSTLPPKITSPGQIWFWLALAAAVSSLTLIIWTVTLFMKFGKGTPAPWDPPQRLVIRGPYRFVRNPMILGVLFFLLAESIFFESWLLFGWMIIFFIGNAIYFPLVEERGLEERFGRDYRRYKEQVPGWIPRLKPWK
jgi:protein-S-isoprenylcysteine O-methyltransferase Ste14